jgi:hypothetical protein
MKTYSFLELESAISNVCDRLGIDLNTKLQQEYQDGKHPKLLSYEKVEASQLQIPTIQKYLIGAKTILNQPCQYYDIFRLCRHYFIIQILDFTIKTVIEKVTNYEQRIEKLVAATTYDSFDSILYELTVASQYANAEGITNVSFLNESNVKSPDFEFILKNEQYCVECKKVARNSDIVSEIRNEIRDKAHMTLHAFLERNMSAIIEVSFHKDPHLISDVLIRDICLEAFTTGATIMDNLLTANAKSLLAQKLTDFILYPSPIYFWKRYGFKSKGDWFGMTNLINAKYGQYNNISDENGSIASTWLVDTKFECVLKWNITDPDIIWQQKRLGYNLLFKGLSQLRAQGLNSILHVWFERDNPIGHRQNELLDFYSRLAKTKKDIFSWIVFNETILDVSLEGRFDLIEHAHPISGPSAKSKDPIVSIVFVKGNDPDCNDGEFGIGPEFPDIDEIYK